MTGSNSAPWSRPLKLLILLSAEEIVEGPVTQTQQVVNTSDQHVVDTVEVEKPKLVKETVQRKKPIIQEKINQVIKHVEVPQVQVVEKTTEILQFGAAELLKFNTSKPGDEQVSLKEYVDRMKEGQNDIWHITGESIAVVSSSPFEENLRQKGLEVLYMVDPVDKHAVQQLKEFNGKKLKSTIKEGLDIGDEDEKKTLEELNTELKPSTKLMKDVLGDKVEMVIASDRIVDSPCVLITSEYGWSAKMERIMEAQALRDNSMTSHMVFKKTVEVNPAAWERQQQQQRESSKHQPTKKSTRQEKEEERDQEGRKEEEKGAEEVRAESVEKDVTGWTEVTRKKKRMVQIFVKVDGGKTSMMEMKMSDKVDDIVKKIPISDQDVYVTSEEEYFEEVMN